MEKKYNLEENGFPIQCNACGKYFEFHNEIPIEDFVIITKAWGYFSKKDGETHKLCLCETCYDNILNQMVIPADILETKELV